MKLSLTTRIFLGYAVVLITFGAVSLFSVSELRGSRIEIRLVSEGYLELSQTVAAIETFQSNQSRDLEGLGREDRFETRRGLIRFARLYFPGLMNKRLDEGRATALKLTEFAPEDERAFVLDVVKKFDELRARFNGYEAAANDVFSLLEEPQPDWGLADRRLKQLEQLGSALSSTIRLLHGSLEARIHERVRRVQERERRTGAAIVALPLVAITVGLLATGFAARSLRPVRRLIEGASRIGRGDYEAKIGIQGDDEIAVLAQEFDSMAEALKEREVLLRQKQAELLRAERLAAMGRVSAQVAHEVRNPLSSVGLNVEMIQEHLESATFDPPSAGAEAKELLAAVVREIDRVTEITEDYLRLARLPSPVLRREEVAPLLDSVLGMASEALERSGISVQRDSNQLALWVLADEGQLRQVFVNLVRNAREAMPKGGVLTVGSKLRDDAVEISFADTGSGMTDEVKAHLFEPFFTTKEGGTGLGLSLSRQILEAHGASIWVESAVGTGTRFTMRFKRS